MKSWNLSDFEEFAPNVLSQVDKTATVQMPAPKRRRNAVKSTAVGLASTAVLVAAVSLVSVQMNVSGSDNELKLSSSVTFTNIVTNRPPLTLLYGAKFHGKWDHQEEAEMLRRAALTLAEPPKSSNEANLIQAVLREELPSERNI